MEQSIERNKRKLSKINKNAKEITNETEIVLIKRDRKVNFDKSPKLGSS